MTPQETQQLQNLLVSAFSTVDDLKPLVYYNTNKDLERLTDVSRGVDSIAFDLLRELERQGITEMLVRGMLAAREHRADIRAFAAQVFPSALQPVAFDAHVQAATVGLNIVASQINAPGVRQAARVFLAQFQSAEQIILQLKKYKILHDCLHTVQVQADVNAYAIAKLADNDPLARLQLRAVIPELRRIAERARANIDGLPTYDLEDSWTDQFQSAVQKMEATLKDRTLDSAIVRTRLGEAYEDLLAPLHQDFARINSNLTITANSLPLASLAQAFEGISPFLAVAAGQLDTGRTALFSLQASITAKVREHYQWQLLHTAITATNGAAELPIRPAEVPRWPKNKAKLEELCAQFANLAWSRDVGARLQEWANADGANTETLRVVADDFRRAALYRFFDVDSELSALCEELTRIALPLKHLLAVI